MYILQLLYNIEICCQMYGLAYTGLQDKKSAFNRSSRNYVYILLNFTQFSQNISQLYVGQVVVNLGNKSTLRLLKAASRPQSFLLWVSR